MILMPMWIVEETEAGYRALLGSEPRTDAESEWIPRGFVVSCVYSPGEAGPRFALVTLKEIPEDIRIKNPSLYGPRKSSGTGG